MALLRPLSGSGAFAVMSEIVTVVRAGLVHRQPRLHHPGLDRDHLLRAHALLRRLGDAEHPTHPGGVPGRGRGGRRRRHGRVSPVLRLSAMPSRPDPDAELEATLRALVRAALGAEVTGFEPIAGQIGLRRFLRVRLAPRPGAPATLVARIEAPEDPASRPSGTPPEPPLEPVRRLLEAHGLPVPARYGGDAAAGIELLEDAGERSLAAAVASAGAETRRALYREVCALRAAPAADRGPRAGRRRLRAPARRRADRLQGDALHRVEPARARAAGERRRSAAPCARPSTSWREAVRARRSAWPTATSRARTSTCARARRRALA